jgi:hypothetical protein
MEYRFESTKHHPLLQTVNGDEVCVDTMTHECLNKVTFNMLLELRELFGLTIPRNVLR